MTTYRGRCARRRANKQAVKQREREALIAEVRAKCAKESLERLRADRETRPYREPTAALCGFPSERHGGHFIEEDGCRSESGEIRITWLGGKQPRYMDVLVPVDVSVARMASTLWRGVAVGDAIAMEMANYNQISNCHFVAREQRVRIAPGNYVHWWNWEPKRGDGYTAAVTLHRHLNAAKTYLGEIHEAARYAHWSGVFQLLEKTTDAFNRGLAGTREWIGLKDPT